MARPIHGSLIFEGVLLILNLPLVAVFPMYEVPQPASP
jgi:hypothetical protein